MQLLQKINSTLINSVTNSVVVIEYTDIRDNSSAKSNINAIKLSKNKKSIAVSSHVEFQDENSIIDWLDKNSTVNTPIILNINSDKIIHKITEKRDKNYDYVNTIIPSADTNQFYSQLFPLGDNKVIVSIVRKIAVENIIKILAKYDSSVIKITIGPFNVTQILPFLEQEIENDFLRINNSTFAIRNQEIVDFSFTPFTINETGRTIKLGSEKISENLLFTYSEGINYLINPLFNNCLSIEKYDNNFNEFIFHRTSRPILVVSGSVLLFILLISTIVFSIFNQKNNNIQYSLIESKNRLLHYNNAVMQENQRNDLLKSNGLYNKSNVSLLLDNLISILPESVYVRKIEVHPVVSRFNSDNTDFMYNTIMIQGNSYTNTVLNDWLTEIKQHKWVKSVLLIEYNQPNDSRIGSFIIEITKKQ